MTATQRTGASAIAPAPVLSDAGTPLFTVFTPTYNRAHTLHRVYESLAAQTFEDFEWLIVDDGSTDDTRTRVDAWRLEADFPIRYIYQQNAGKHIAFNRGVQAAAGELFLPLDSDDGCVPNALARLWYHWQKIPGGERERFSAVSVSCQDQNGLLVGTRFPRDPTDSDSMEIRYRYKVKGEKWGFHRTEVLRRYPFPEELSRTYVPESVVWDRIARDYKTRYVNEMLRIYWMDAPSTVNFVSPSRNAPGRALYYRQVLNEQLDLLPVAPLRIVRAALNYGRSSLHAKVDLHTQQETLSSSLGRILWAATLPAATLVYAGERVRERAQSRQRDQG